MCADRVRTDGIFGAHVFLVHFTNSVARLKIQAARRQAFQKKTDKFIKLPTIPSRVQSTLNRLLRHVQSNTITAEPELTQFIAHHGQETVPEAIVQRDTLQIRQRFVYWNTRRYPGVYRPLCCRHHLDIASGMAMAAVVKKWSRSSTQSTVVDGNSIICGTCGERLRFIDFEVLEGFDRDGNLARTREVVSELLEEEPFYPGSSEEESVHSFVKEITRNLRVVLRPRDMQDVVLGALHASALTLPTFVSTVFFPVNAKK